MVLHVMRHGPAEDRAPSGRDADRALTPEGCERVRRVAAELLRLRGGAPIPRVLSSPARRARETAEILAAAAGGAAAADAVELCDELGLDAGVPLGLAGELAALAEDVLLVGHQPNVEHLVRGLASATATWPAGLLRGFSTAMIVVLEPELRPGAPARWRVQHVVDPRELA